MSNLIKDIPINSKPREKALKDGIRSLNDNELLAIILKCGSRDKSALCLANEILNDYQIYELGNVSLNKLKKYQGMGEVKALSIIASIEIGRRAIKHIEKHDKLMNAEQIFNLYRNYFIFTKQEKLLALFLNTKNELIKEKIIFVGSINTSIIHPREILKKGIDYLACKIIIIHNHPSGDSTPSKTDIEFTKRIIDAGNLVDIPIIDHIIIGNDNYYSFFMHNNDLF